MSEPPNRQGTAPPAAEPAPATLDYQQATPEQRVRRWLLRIALILAAIILVETGLYYWSDVSNWLALVRLRHEVMTYTMPARTPVVTQKPADSKANWLSPSSSHSAPPNHVWINARISLIPPASVGTGHGVTVFLHVLRCPSGHRRVLAINMSLGYLNDNSGANMPMDLRLFDPGTLRNPRFTELSVKESKELHADGSIPNFPGLYADLGTVPWGSSFQLFGGEIDPNDSSKFTIGYILNGKPGQFIGQLNDDDSISLIDANGAKLPGHFPPAATQPNTP